ncbi:MAG: hypothetical protein QM572_12030 [Nocardioides sp.]|uniref:hypothetical protein n=1 Tax=Nocardioides sp. TaxID=35761 RepID=UPI0039E32740
MRFPHSPHELRRRRLLVAGAGAALLLISVSTYAALVHRAAVHSVRVEQRTASEGPTTRAAAPPSAVPSSLDGTDDPEGFARSAALAIFEWDTATMLRREDHIEQIVVAGDPAGESTAGLLSDLSGYVPTDAAWIDLAQYATRQWLTIDSLTTPAKWDVAVAQAGSALLPGTAAFTVRGVRHRTGTWDGAPISTEHRVAFTVFVVCGPTYPECHLLRLSILDKPLD